MSVLASGARGGEFAPMKPVLLIAGVLSAVLAAVRVEPIIVYNRTASVPVGYYVRVDRDPRAGDFVTVRAASVAPHYASVRGYDDPSDRFLKRVAAVAGERVCASGARVAVGERLTLVRRSHDLFGNALPAWSGCRTLGNGEVLLLGDTADSFDGRYWGPVRIGDIDGVWRPFASQRDLQRGHDET